jgi:hypothetical protein
MHSGQTKSMVNKQGDALSCSLFVLCMDPLIRKINEDNQIAGLNIGNGILIGKVCGMQTTLSS